MYVVENKITGWIILQYKIIITKYQNIAINSFSIKHKHAHEDPQMKKPVGMLFN
jgi:hypothetical protein